MIIVTIITVVLLVIITVVAIIVIIAWFIIIVINVTVSLLQPSWAPLLLLDIVIEPFFKVKTCKAVLLPCIGFILFVQHMKIE